jgi:hypothetical protein
MKAVILPLVVGLLLFAAVSVRLRFAPPAQPARALLGLYLAFLPVLTFAYFLAPADLGFLSPQLVAPGLAIEFGFAVFLYSAGFFGGLLQLYNLADRGLSLRILIDILESPRGGMTFDEIAAGYGGGRGIVWMYEKRLEGMAYSGLADLIGDRLVLTARGSKAARVFSLLQAFARVGASGAS